MKGLYMGGQDTFRSKRLAADSTGKYRRQIRVDCLDVFGQGTFI